MKLKRFHIIPMLLFPVVVSAQARPAACEVRPLWVSGGVRSANPGRMGTLQTDGREGQTIRSFKLEGTRLVATVGIDHVFEYASSKQTPYEIRLAITVADHEKKELFESVDSAEASTRYRKKWSLSVTRNINFENVLYMFTLRCWDSSSAATQRVSPTATPNNPAGKVNGIVKDIHDTALQGVSIVFENKIGGKKFKRKVESSSFGSYETHLLVGMYRVTVKSPGFRKFQHKELIVEAGKSTTFDIVLKENPRTSTTVN